MINPKTREIMGGVLGPVAGEELEPSFCLLVSWSFLLKFDFDQFELAFTDIRERRTEGINPGASLS